MTVVCTSLSKRHSWTRNRGLDIHRQDLYIITACAHCNAIRRTRHDMSKR